MVGKVYASSMVLSIHALGEAYHVQYSFSALNSKRLIHDLEKPADTQNDPGGERECQPIYRGKKLWILKTMLGKPMVGEGPL